MSSEPIQVRWSDCDGLGHVNFAVFLTYLEHGRDQWLQEVLGSSFAGDQYVVGRVEVDYRHEIPAATAQVRTDHELETIGSSSITLRERLHDGAARVFAESRIVLVMWDAERRTSRPLFDWERTALRGAEATHALAGAELNGRTAQCLGRSAETGPRFWMPTRRRQEDQQ